MSRAGHEVYDVAAEQDGLPLAAGLRRLRPAESWSQVRRLIVNRHVQINDDLCLDEGHKLSAGDVIKVWKEPRAPRERPEEVQIRYLDAHLVVVEKPAGMSTLRYSEEKHGPRPRPGSPPTLDELVCAALARQAKGHRGAAGHRVKPPSLRIVHRLDRQTSGLLVFARTAEAERQLAQMFRRHEIHRLYLAIVHGHVAAQTFESVLVRDRGDGRRGSTPLAGVGKRAVTHVRPVEHFDGYTLVECRLETGRTHQIRIHLAEAGHMVCGEKVYRCRLHGNPIDDQSGAQRQALHAAELGLKHPISGELLKFEMPLPPDMLGLLERLRDQKRKSSAGH
jgi:23S rRNA pseudouridine1911/1915/1917 synthase